MFFSGEFHPFRLPVTGLWLDVFQKIKAMGYSGVSFYVDWALLEGKPGDFRAEGIFALEPFFEAASEAGIYLLARPGPYINAEASGGGFPGWLQRVEGVLRTNATSYEDATNNYAKNVGEIIAAAQITNGGPIILMQPENEYTSAESWIPFPNYYYLKFVEDQFRDAGVIVPFMVNDASPQGIAAPGTGIAAADIYGHDGYPLGFDCELCLERLLRVCTNYIQVQILQTGQVVVCLPTITSTILNRVPQLPMQSRSFKVAPLTHGTE